MGSDDILSIDGFIYSSPDKSCARLYRVLFSAGEAKRLSLRISLLLSFFFLLRLRAYNKCHISFQLLPIFFPRVMLSPAHLASLITGRSRRDRALSYGTDKSRRFGCSSVLRDKLFFRSKFSIIARLQNSWLVLARRPRIFLR